MLSLAVVVAAPDITEPESRDTRSFVMDEAQTLAPSGPMTPCTQSTLALVAQARKYGLGLILATQAPKALHNRIPGNAKTQFLGGPVR